MTRSSKWFSLLCLWGLSLSPSTQAQALSATEVPRVRKVVGSLEARSSSSLAAQTSGRVLEVLVSEGDRVQKGQKLAQIDDRTLALKISQAKSAVEEARAGSQEALQMQAAAEAARDEALAAQARVQKFLKQEAATPQQMEAADSAALQAKAHVERARFGVQRAKAGFARAQEALEEVRVLRAYSEVLAPEDGIVTARKVEPGDLAHPGKPLFTLQAEGPLRLVARVPESLAGRITLGDSVEVGIDARDESFQGEVVEVVPVADPFSRKFTVKIQLPENPGLLPGMFGRAEIPLGTESILCLPKDRLTQRGQLWMTRVQSGDRSFPRLVRLGRTLGCGVEILSGLKPGEVLAEEAK